MVAGRRPQEAQITVWGMLGKFVASVVEDLSEDD
jgi:hypothetical protein